MVMIYARIRSFMPNPPIAILELPQKCLSHEWQTFQKRCYWLVIGKNTISNWRWRSRINQNKNIDSDFDNDIVILMSFQTFSSINQE